MVYPVMPMDISNNTCLIFKLILICIYFKYRNNINAEIENLNINTAVGLEPLAYATLAKMGITPNAVEDKSA